MDTFFDQDQDIPRIPIDDLMDDLNQDEDMADPDDRRNQRLLDTRIQADGELSDSDDEGEGGRRDHKSHKEDEPMQGRKFSVATGIMNAGPAASTHGAGPSGHPPAIPPPLASTTEAMEVDEEAPPAVPDASPKEETTKSGDDAA
jgi:histone deacetylase 1/2